MKKAIAVVLSVFTLAACVSLIGCTSTPTADLYAGEVSLTQIEQAAYTYTTLPLCGTEKPGELCRTLATERAIRTAKKTADQALIAAKSAITPGSVANFQLALQALTALVPVAVSTVLGDK